jgi:hypothetical protein
MTFYFFDFSVIQIVNNFLLLRRIRCNGLQLSEQGR